MMRTRTVSLVITLKFFHYLALFLAGGLGVANGMLASAHAKAATPPAPPVQQTMMRLARLGLVALLLIWVTGLGLYHALYQDMPLSLAFGAKLLGASLLLGTVCMVNIHLSQSRKANRPPNQTFIRRLTMISRGALILVLFCIAIVTT
ncbi:MAG: hypothetical protein ACON49_04810 [Candidatus Puniceispirillaceae bacterium]